MERTYHTLFFLPRLPCGTGYLHALALRKRQLCTKQALSVAAALAWCHRTPAMAAGLTDHVWTLHELLTAKFEPIHNQSDSGCTPTCPSIAQLFLTPYQGLRWCTAQNYLVEKSQVASQPEVVSREYGLKPALPRNCKRNEICEDH